MVQHIAVYHINAKINVVIKKIKICNNDNKKILIFFKDKKYYPNR